MFIPILILAAIAVVALGAMGIYGLGVLVALLVVLAIAGVFAASRRKGEPIATIERQKPMEPTGRPRSASGDAETANERVGQA